MGRLPDHRERCSEGLADPEALQQVYRTVQRRLVGYLRVLVGEAAEDVASQVWLEMASAARPSDGDERLCRLAFVIARRRASDLRRGWWRRKVVIRPPGSAGLDGIATDNPPLDDATVRLLRMLPPRQAEVVLLRVLAGFSTEEVAELMGMTAGNVRIVQHRALEALRRRLGTAGSRDEV